MPAIAVITTTTFLKRFSFWLFIYPPPPPQKKKIKKPSDVVPKTQRYTWRRRVRVISCERYDAKSWCFAVFTGSAQKRHYICYVIMIRAKNIDSLQLDEKHESRRWSTRMYQLFCSLNQPWKIENLTVVWCFGIRYNIKGKYVVRVVMIIILWDTVVAPVLVLHRWFFFIIIIKILGIIIRFPNNYYYISFTEFYSDNYIE